MRILHLLLITFSIISIFSKTSNAQDMDAPQAQEVTLNRETVELLLSVLSPNCREEMESALEANSGEMSIECQKEIESNLGQFRSNQDRNFIDESSENFKKNGKPNDGNPLFWIVVFLVVFFSAIGIYIFVVNSFQEGGFSRKTKKLSKKKVIILKTNIIIF